MKAKVWVGLWVLLAIRGGLTANESPYEPYESLVPFARTAEEPASWIVRAQPASVWSVLGQPDALPPAAQGRGRWQVKEPRDAVKAVKKLHSSLSRLAETHRKLGRGASMKLAKEKKWVFDGEMIEVILEPSVKRRAATISKASIHGLGGVVTGESKSLLRVKLPIGRLEQAASEIGGIRLIRPPVRPIELAAISEGVGLTGANVWQEAGYNGAGVKVAVIDGGFEYLSIMPAGEIPPGWIGYDPTGTGLETGTQHGVAVAEAVIDMAPAVQLYCIKVADDLDLELAKDYCVAQDVNVVNHSMAWAFFSDRDGQGRICEIAEDAAANGILWVNSAGNYAQQHWQDYFDDSGEVIDYGGGVLKPLTDFSDGTEVLYLSPSSISAGTTIVAELTWDAWSEPNQDYDFFLYKDGTGIVQGSMGDQTAGEEPWEAIVFDVTSSGRYGFLVSKYSAWRNHRLNLFVYTDGVIIDNPVNRIAAGSCVDPAVSADVFAVAAIDEDNWPTGPQEVFSSRGPTNGGLIKPDITGPDDCVSAIWGWWQGTSQSSPHVAGAAALVLDANPTFTNDQIRSFLEGRAIDIGDPNKDNIYGWGLLDFGPLVNTHTISGRVTVGGSGLEGVTIVGLPGNPVTDANGDYSTEVADGWTGTGTPQKEGYTFLPPFRIYNNVISDRADQNYAATLLTYTISGTVPYDGNGLADVTMVGLPGNPVTDANGYYTATVDYNWSGTATPQKPRYAFTPPQMTYVGVKSDQTSEDYAAVFTYIISGTVTRDSNGLEGVELTGLPGPPVTDLNGEYAVEVPDGWDGTVIPEKEGYTFDPCFRDYSNVDANQPNQDYTAEIIMLTISGTVTYKGSGLADVNMTGLPGPPFTDANGHYSAEVEYWSTPTVVPIRQGFRFQPVDRTYPAVKVDQPNQNYVAFLTHPVWNVNTDIRYLTIQAAIDAPLTLDGHELIVDGGREYTGQDALANFRGKQLDIHSSDVNDPEATKLNGRNLYGPIVTFSNCGSGARIAGFKITGGVALFGGGISCENSSPTIANCIIQGNRASYYGGGIDLYLSEALIVDCKIIGNTASDGAGINSELDMSTVVSCEITSNTASDVGGAVQAVESSLAMKNCFISNNQSADVGGAIYLWNSDSQIGNCTIVANTGSYNYGGIYCDNRTLAEPAIINSIVWNNGNELYDCEGLVSYSCVQDGAPGEGNTDQDPLFIDGYYLSNTAAGQWVQSPCVDAGSADANDPNIALDHLTTRTDQVPDAGPVDMGYHFERGAVTTFTLTTSVNDSNMGTISRDPNDPCGIDPNYTYPHYTWVTVTAEPVDINHMIVAWSVDGVIVPNYTGSTYDVEMTADHEVVVTFAEKPWLKLTLNPVAGSGGVLQSLIGTGGSVINRPRPGDYWYRYGEKAVIQVTPDTGYVPQWLGTDDDYSIEPNNTVTMDANNKAVTVSFRWPQDRFVPGQYDTIGDAMTAAVGGDRVVVAAGVYTGGGNVNLDFGGKAITVTSQNPDDANIVAATIIDCAGAGRAFVLRQGEGFRSVIEGFTILNGVAPWNDPEFQVPAPPSPFDGLHGRDAGGGAIACFNGSSPTISNCVIRNCIARGQPGADGARGADGAAGTDGAAGPDGAAGADGNDPRVPGSPPMSPDGEPGADGNDGLPGVSGSDANDGGDGGWGGWAYGGALFFDSGSTPRIIRCTIEGCAAIGGDAGAGANGGNGGDGGDGGTGGLGGIGGNGWDSNDVNGIYPDGIGGNGGDGGDGGPGGTGGSAGNGGNGGTGGSAIGGAIFFGANCKPIILSCAVTDCNTIEGMGNVGGTGGTGGFGGNGGYPGLGGTAGTGTPDGGDGQLGSPGTGGAGGKGGSGGNGGSNGWLSAGGAIFYDVQCEVQVSDTDITECAADVDYTTIWYAGGDGNNPGLGGSPGGNPNQPGLLGTTGGGFTWTPGGADLYDWGCTAVLTNCTITDNNAVDGEGGGEYYSQCHVVLNNCDISRNWAHFVNVWGGGRGGGQYFSGTCVVDVNHCTFVDNNSVGDGGGQRFGGGSAVHTINSSFINNTCNSGAGGGQWFDNTCTAEVTDSNFINNRAGGGEGGGQRFGNNAVVKVAGSNYGENHGNGDGGGLYVPLGCSLDINDTSFTDNWADASLSKGGGVYYGGTTGSGSGLRLTVSSSRFAGNIAEYGGGLYWYGGGPFYPGSGLIQVEISDSLFSSNRADHGGGLFWSKGSPMISRCIVAHNTARGRWIPNTYGPEFGSYFYGGGAGIFCWTSDAQIEDCFIGHNAASGAGGGVYFGGGSSLPILKNCLVVGNSAVLDGGGIVSYWFVIPTISNCTIVDNTANDAADATHGRGGGLSCSYESETTLIDSILWGNTGTNGNQIAIGSDSDPLDLQHPAVLTVSYCDVQGDQTPQAIYIEPGRTLNWLSGNIDADPCFVANFYLSQIAAGQAANSPCVDTGSDLAVNLGLDSYSTRTDGVGDAGQVDMGVHTRVTGQQYQLTVHLVDPHGGAVTPSGGFFNAGDVVTLKATPADGYRTYVIWSGTDNDSVTATTNTVTMDRDRVVYVTLERIRAFLVPGSEFHTIGGALASMDPDGRTSVRDGDSIIVSPGVYRENNLDFWGRAITIASEKPDDPATVAATIIDCQGGGRAFVLQNGEGTDSVINGFTIINGGGSYGRPGRPNPANPGIAGTDGAHAYGGAVACFNGSSVTIANCVIKDCVARGRDGQHGGYGSASGAGADGAAGGDGGEGMGGDDPGNPYGPDGGPGGDGIDGGNGGSGVNGGDGGDGGQGGWAYGGALYFDTGSAPVVLNTRMINCRAIGGDGGDGGDGGLGGNGGLGADGGDGGDGGDIIFVIDPNENTLIRFKFRQHFKADSGKHGLGSNKHGHSGKHEILPVPYGTILRDEATGKIIADLSEKDDRVVVAKGGRGGRGNSRFATSTNQTPRRADSGIPGEEKTLLLELKLLADVGLVGFPNAGKSTLLSRVSSAHPRIADYPFTTLQPNLGIVKYGDMKSFVMADIPGIIEGAHEGKGLGFQFLRHIERTKVLLFLVECTEENPVEVYRKLLSELELFSKKMMNKPRFVALTKTDLFPPGPAISTPDFGNGMEAFPISAVSGSGIDRLVYRLGEEIEAASEKMHIPEK